MTESVYDQVHREYLDRSSDPAWKLAFEIYLGELVGEISGYHQGHIQAIADQSALKQIGKAKNQIVKQFLLNKLMTIRKDATDFKEGNWRREHGRFAAYVGPHVNERPRFTPQGQPIHLGTRAQDYHEVVRNELSRMSYTEQQKPHHVVGYLAKPIELPVDVSDAEHKADVLQRAAELTHDLENKTRNPENKQRIQYLVTNPDGYSRIITPQAGNVPGQGDKPNEINWEGGERVQYMTPVGPDHPVMVAGQALNIGHVMGASPENAAKLGSVAQDIHNTITSTSWGAKLQAAANAARVMSDNSPATVQAHAVAQLINLVGPEAARAFGPKLRQLSYRYSGQEATPEQYSQVAKDINEGKAGPLVRPRENALAEDLRKDLPSRKAYAASLQAGSTPPSHGFILDKKGKVVSEAVGFSDDWYAPFNLNKLPNLRGGSYVRSRGYGGITPEDLRLALRTGAKRVTVVSNNGTFTLELAPQMAHWGHRFGFAGNAMVRRYAKSLDAIKNGRVTDPETEQKLALNSKGYEAAMHDLLMKYPYWISRPGQSGIPFYEPGRGPEAQIGEPDDKGYVKPLSINATGAMGGWAEPGVQEPWATGDNIWKDNKTGKYAYDSHERYKLQQDQALRVIRMLGEAPKTTSTGNTWDSRAKTTWGTTGQNANAVNAQRAYPIDEKWTTQQGDRALIELRRLMQQNDKLSAPNDLKGSNYLEDIYATLTSDASGWQSSKNYKELREKLTENPDWRKSLATEIGDIYSHPSLRNTVSELLPRLTGESRQEDDDETGAAAAAMYSDSDTPPHATVISSPSLTSFINQKKMEADEGNADAKTLISQWNFYLNRLQEEERALRERREPPALTFGQRHVRDEINTQVVRRLNQEKERANDPGDRGDSGERSWGSGVATWNSKLRDHILNEKTDPADVVQDITVRVYDKFDNQPDQLDRTMDEWSGMFRHRATDIRRGKMAGSEEDAHKLDHIANLLDEQTVAAQDARNLEHRLNARNT